MERLRTPDKLAGALGAVLLVSLFTPWYTAGDLDASAFEALSFIDLWLAFFALMGLALAAITATRDAPALPVALDVLTFWTGVIAGLLMLLRLLDVPGPEGIDRGWGLFLSAICVFGLSASAWKAMRDESAPGLRPNPVPERQPVPPADAPVS